MCVVYRMSALSYMIMSRLITIPHISLVNIVAQQDLVREFLQEDANADTISREMFEILDNADYRAQIQAGLERVRSNLGSGNGAENMAQLVLSLLPESG